MIFAQTTKTGISYHASSPQKPDQFDGWKSTPALHRPEWLDAALRTFNIWWTELTSSLQGRPRSHQPLPAITRVKTPSRPSTKISRRNRNIIRKNQQSLNILKHHQINHHLLLFIRDPQPPLVFRRSCPWSCFGFGGRHLAAAAAEGAMGLADSRFKILDMHMVKYHGIVVIVLGC